MPKLSLEMLELKQKIYLQMIVKMQRELDKTTKIIKSTKAKQESKKAAAPKAPAKKTAKKRGRPAKAASKPAAKPAAKAK